MVRRVHSGLAAEVVGYPLASPSLPHLLLCFYHDEAIPELSSLSLPNDEALLAAELTGFMWSSVGLVENLS